MEILIRNHPIPRDVDVTALLGSLSVLKQHPDYLQAKAGSPEHALQLVSDLALAEIYQFRADFPPGCIFVAPHAREVTGDNAIPQTLAEVYALVCGGKPDRSVHQISKVYHTGADAMQRLLHPPKFAGNVVAGAQYVLVDDVTNIGSTLAELANYIQAFGGLVFDMAVLVNDGREKSIHPRTTLLNTVKERFAHETVELFGAEPDALTANEVKYIAGFRHADDLRGRAGKAQQARDIRLRSKGLLDGPETQA